MNRRPNEQNERVKRRYLEYRKHAGRLAEKSLDKEIAAIERFDIWNRRKNFAHFHIEQAIQFRVHLESAISSTGKPLGKSTMLGIHAALRKFILWLSQQEGFRRRIKAADSEYFNLSRRDEAEARAAPQKPAPSVAQAKRALSLMPEQTIIERRNKAIVSLLCLTGIRVGALISLRVKHIDLSEKSVTQNPREVATKFGKPIDTFLARDFEEAERTLSEWVAYLNETALFNPDDPLFPATDVTVGPNGGFQANGLKRRFWKTTEPVRRIVKEAFEAANIPNYGPHSFRHMLARHAVATTESVEELVAAAQNLGHTDILTTLRSYGQVSRTRQKELIRGE